MLFVCLNEQRSPLPTKHSPTLTFSYLISETVVLTFAFSMFGNSSLVLISFLVIFKTPILVRPVLES